MHRIYSVKSFALLKQLSCFNYKNKFARRNTSKPAAFALILLTLAVLRLYINTPTILKYADIT